jgi:hypothetical protein
LITARTCGGLGALPILAATSAVARTRSGRSVASMRATRLPKAPDHEGWAVILVRDDGGDVAAA